MKRLLAASFLLFSFYGFAQNNVPVIKQGSKLNYSITTENGSIQILVKIDSLSPSYLKLRWSAPEVGTGIWEIKAKSLESANTGRWSKLEPDANITLPDNEIVVLFSKAQWASIQKDKKTEFDMVQYTVKKNPQPSKLNDKDVDVVYLENEDATSKLWILNSPSFPAIIKISGNKAGPDAELKSVE